MLCSRCVTSWPRKDTAPPRSKSFAEEGTGEESVAMAHKKLKILYLAQYLQQQSDEEHPVSINDMIA